MGFNVMYDKIAISLLSKVPLNFVFNERFLPGQTIDRKESTFRHTRMTKKFMEPSIKL
jgi:hypothetical protein